MARDSAQITDIDRHKLATQPATVHEGLVTARNALRHGLQAAYSDVMNQQEVCSYRMNFAITTQSFAIQGPNTMTMFARAFGSLPSAGLRPLIAACQAATASLQVARLW